MRAKALEGSIGPSPESELPLLLGRPRTALAKNVAIRKRRRQTRHFESGEHADLSAHLLRSVPRIHRLGHHSTTRITSWCSWWRGAVAEAPAGVILRLTHWTSRSYCSG